MDNHQRYLFDLQGYLIIRNLLTPDLTARLLAATEALENRVCERWAALPAHRGCQGLPGRRDDDLGIFVSGSRDEGDTWVIEDFWNADPAYLELLDHAPTLDIVRATIRGRVTINNSEVRIRHRGNRTGAHMGGPMDAKYQYRHDGAGFDCMMTRMVYLLHDVGIDDGPFSAVPGTHKSVYPPPPAQHPEDEPNMIPLTGKAGDAIFFTEAMRHGGFINRNSRSRRTIHVGYGPAWMHSQNFGTMDDAQYLNQRTWDAMRPGQRELFMTWPEGKRPQPRPVRARELTC